MWCNTILNTVSQKNDEIKVINISVSLASLVFEASEVLPSSYS